MYHMVYLDTLLLDEKSRLKTEYQTMLVNVSDILAKESRNERIEIIWYAMLKEEQFYRNSKYVKYFALQFLDRS